MPICRCGILHGWKRSTDSDIVVGGHTSFVWWNLNIEEDAADTGAPSLVVYCLNFGSKKSQFVGVVVDYGLRFRPYANAADCLSAFLV